MSKIEKIIKLINLLSHRRFVTMETIMSTCDIPQRTAYRYLNTISEANIPVYYDKERHAYALNRNRTWLTASLELGDAMLVALALRLLKKHVNAAYQDDIEQLISQLLVQQPCPAEDVMDTFQGTIRESGDTEDYSPLVTSMLLHAAILCERRVRLTTNNGVKESREIDVESPRLLFRRKWHVVDAADETNGIGTSLSDVRKVSIS